MPFKEALNTLITQANLSERDKRSELEAREAARKRELKNQDAERTRILRKADALITPILNTVRNQLKRGDIIRTWSSSNTIYEIKLTWDVGVNNSYSFGTFKQIVASVTLDTGSIELSAGSDV